MDNIETEKAEAAKGNEQKPVQFKKKLQLLLPGRISRLHLFEAKERYLTLKRMLEYHEKTSCADPASEKEKVTTIQICREILDNAEKLVTRNQEDLNELWREMIRVHIMLLEKILPDELLPAQLDFCREEAFRLGLTKDSEVNDMLQRLAEVTTDRDPKQNRDKMFRAIRALLERFNTIRTGRIHQQFVNIRTYKFALLILVPISLLLIANANLILPSTTSASAPSFPGEVGLSNLLKYIHEWSKYLLQSNSLAFVFFGGLTGGFFSVVIRLRDHDLVPGEDAYFIWYVLSKPFVGALSAVILFILFQGGLVDLELLKKTGTGPSAKVFGFAFLAGFSERIIFPKFR